MATLELTAKVEIVRTVFPDCLGADLVARLDVFTALEQQPEVQMAGGGKNQDYQRGYEVGAWLANTDPEGYDFKELDALARELYEGTNWGELPVNRLEYFADGVSNGYTITSFTQEQQ